MVQMGPVNFDRKPEDYLHLFTKESKNLERRKFKSDLLIDILTNKNNRKDYGAVILHEETIRTEYLGNYYKVLVAKKGRFIDFDGKWITRVDTEVQGAIFNGDERVRQYKTKDGITLDVTVIQPIPNDDHFKESIIKEVYLRGLAKKGEKIYYL